MNLPAITVDYYDEFYEANANFDDYTDVQHRDVSIRKLNSIDIFDLVVDMQIANVRMPSELLNIINWAIYIDRRGGQYARLISNEEFMNALAWHDGDN
jgi:hypothetical protein